VARRAARSFGPRRGNRKGTAWGRLVETAYTPVANGTKVLLATLNLDNQGITETLVRTIGMISIVSDQFAASEDQMGAFGVVRVSDLAITAGAASIPGPVTDASDEGWVVWQPFVQRLLVGGTTAQQLSTQYHFESKGARRVETGFALALMVENSGATGLHAALAISTLSVVNA